jgi:hypothetical protein
MDLVTLVAACALTVDPKLMHALIWHQSGGEPWSFSVAGERQPLVYRSVREAVREAQTALPQGRVHVGLTGLAAESTSATEAMFTPCLNISIAARQITQLVDRCKAVPSFKADPVHCAIAAYRGSWDHPDNKFADAVATSAANGDASNFDMLDSTDVGSGELVPEAAAGQHVSTLSPGAPDDQQRGWSSALFPPRSKPSGRVSTSSSSSTPDADRLQESSELSAPATTARPPDDGLLVRRLPERRPQ